MLYKVASFHGNRIYNYIYSYDNKKKIVFLTALIFKLRKALIICSLTPTFLQIKNKNTIIILVSVNTI